MVSWQDRELKGTGGVKRILQELEKHYRREGKVHMMSKVKAYYQIQRGNEEHLGYYIQRYQKIARECQNAGGEVFNDGVRGWHPVGQVGISELEEQVILGACQTGDGYEKMKSELMRIFGERK